MTNLGVGAVVVGDSGLGTGKSNLIITLATDHDSFPDKAPPGLPPTRLPHDFYLDRVPDTIIDTPYRYDSTFQYDVSGASYTLKWTFHNELGLVFVAVYQRMLHLLYVDELPSLVKHKFSTGYIDDRSFHDFDDTFQQLLQEAEARAAKMKRNKQVQTFHAVKKVEGGRQSKKFQGKGKKSTFKKGGNGGDDDEGDANGGAPTKKASSTGLGYQKSNRNAKVQMNGKANRVANYSANGHASGSSSSDNDGGEKSSEAGENIRLIVSSLPGAVEACIDAVGAQI